MDLLPAGHRGQLGLGAAEHGHPGRGQDTGRTRTSRLRTSRVLLETLLEAESSLRGYLLTGDRRFLQPYRSALTTLQRVRTDVSRLMSEDLAHARRVPELDKAIDDKLAELDEKATLFSQETAMRRWRAWPKDTVGSGWSVCGD